MFQTSGMRDRQTKHLLHARAPSQSGLSDVNGAAARVQVRTPAAGLQTRNMISIRPIAIDRSRRRDRKSGRPIRPTDRRPSILSP